jgi:hypothetical protein
MWPARASACSLIGSVFRKSFAYHLDCELHVRYQILILHAGPNLEVSFEVLGIF